MGMDEMSASPFISSDSGTATSSIAGSLSSSPKSSPRKQKRVEGSGKQKRRSRFSDSSARRGSEVSSWWRSGESMGEGDGEGAGEARKERKLGRSHSDGPVNSFERARRVLAPEPRTTEMLIVLDLDGVVWERNGRNISPTDGVHEFLAKCFEIAKVGFYTSSAYKNVVSGLHDLLTPEQEEETAFLWTRNMCEKAPTKDKPHGTQKPLIKIYKRFKCYGPLTTVIVDDSAEKMLQNPPNNTVIVVAGEELESTFSKIVDSFGRLQVAAR